MRTRLETVAADVRRRTAKSEIRNPKSERSPKPETRNQSGSRLHGIPPDSAFTLIEIMVVVIVIGILAATIIPQFITTTHDAKVGAAKGHIAELESALERFNINMDRYPTMEEGLKVLVEPPSGDDQKNWRGPYIKQLRADPWGVPNQYLAPGVNHTTSFNLWSRGADKTDGGEGKGADVGNWQ